MSARPDPVTVVSGSTFYWNALLFTRALRAAGISTDIGGAIDYSRALTLVDIGDREQVRASGMAIFVRRREEVPVYDEVFGRFWDVHELDLSMPGLDIDMNVAEIDAGARDRLEAVREAGPDEAAIDGPAVSSDTADAGDADATDEASGPHAWSERERLLHKPFERMSPEELRDAERLVDRLRPRLEMRRTRRSELHRHGSVMATRQMFRRNLHSGGDMVEWLWRRPRLAPRSISILCDISGSMERHARLLIRFAMALRRVSAVRTEAFVFGTQLTRVTRELALREPDAALDHVTEAVSDWSGGTRIGESLRQFNTEWSRRVLRSSGIVIVVSDGWDRGDPQLVHEQMARLQRSCHRLIWLDPLAGSEHYQPLAGGIAAAYPFIDDLVPVTDLESLEHLGHLLAEMADHRHQRPARSGRPRVHRIFGSAPGASGRGAWA
jgi:uncharacterized protein with von Willebrand factor type A (vWA) domain